MHGSSLLGISAKVRDAPRVLRDFDVREVSGVSVIGQRPLSSVQNRAELRSEIGRLVGLGEHRIAALGRRR
jgi:hypothetical protein